MINADNSSSIPSSTNPRLPINPVLVSTGRRGGGKGEPAPPAVPLVRVAYSDAHTAILQGDVRAALRVLPAASIDCVVTSPPYWGLRDYGLPAQIWGGEAECSHDWSEDSASGSACSKCHAWRGQLGLEPSPELYVEHMVEVFRELRRVLKPEGTLWINLGDCYNAATNAPRRPSANRVGYWQAAGSMGDRRVKVAGLKAQGHGRHPLAGGAGVAGGRLVSALRRDLVQTQSDSRRRPRSAGALTRVSVPAGQAAALLL